MGVNKLIWVGLICCLAALTIQLFPEAAFQLGADVKASWLVFGFGIFLILIASFLGKAPRLSAGRKSGYRFFAPDRALRDTASRFLRMRGGQTIICAPSGAGRRAV